MDKKHVLLNRIARKCAGAADLAASLLYPPRCMFCGELLEPEERERMICAKCAPKLPFVGKSSVCAAEKRSGCLRRNCAATAGAGGRKGAGTSSTADGRC